MAILFSVFFYVGVFEACWYVILKSHTNTYALIMYGFPLLIVGYYILMGTWFYELLKLHRWILWLSMNFAGFIISVIILFIHAPRLWFNSGMLLLLMPMLGVFSVLWVVLGIFTLILKWYKKVKGSPKIDIWKKL